MADAFPDTTSTFSTVDYAIFVLLLAGSVLLGILAGWRSSRSDVKDFLTGGRDMNPVAVMLSLLGGVVSALSVLGNSTEMYFYGTQLAVNLLGCLWGTFVVIFFLLPVVYPLHLVTINHYLELRFDSPLVRKLGSLCQIMKITFYLGICLYAPSLTLSSVTSMSTSTSIIVLGVICSLYISVGGVRAVVYTDVLQTIVMFVGVLVVVVQVSIDVGGVAEVWRRASEGGRIQFFNMDPNPLVRHTFWSVQVLGAYFLVNNIGTSQAQYQRLTSVSSLRTSQGLCVAFFVGLFLLWSLFYFSGIVAYAAYQDCDPLSTGRIEKPDQILAFLVADKLHHLSGMTGIFVAAVAGAVLSSLSSQANSMVVLLWGDFLSGWWIFGKMSERATLTFTRILSSCIGLLTIGFAFLVANLGTLFQVGLSITGALVSPLDGLFVTAIAAPWVSSKGAIAGFVSALTFNLWLIIGKFVTGAGTSERLPLSTECLSDALDANGTHADMSVFAGTTFVNGSLDATLATTMVPTAGGFPDDRDNLWVYDISYCYIGTLGILIVFIVSTIVSVATGVPKPDDVDSRLVDKRCLTLYRKMFGVCCPRRSYDVRNAAEVSHCGSDNKAAAVSDELGEATGTRVEMKTVQ